MSLPPSAEKVRVRIDPNIHEQARQSAQARGMAVGDYLELLVRQDADAEARQAQKLAAAKGDRAAERIEGLYASFDSLGEQFRHAIETLRTDLPKALDAGFAGMRSHISNTGGTAHLRDMIGNAEARSEKRDAVMQSAIVTQLKTDRETLRGMLDHESRLRRAEASQQGRHVAIGAAAVLLIFLVPAFFFSNTWLTRWPAIRLFGATDRYHAASNLLEGDTESGFLLLRTQLLLNEQKNFRADYRTCMKRVEQASARFICKIRFEPLIKAKGRAGS
jgi:hypothetical protein